MSDQELNFRPPVQRRQPRRFEPPPWEKEAFEAARETAEETGREQEHGHVESEEQVRTQEQESKRSDEPAAAGGVEERVMLEMLADLAAQEPKADKAVHRVAYASALFLVLVGGVLIVWGMAALVSSSTTGMVGTLGGSVMLLFGAGFTGAAVWLAIRTLRQQGVL